MKEQSKNVNIKEKQFENKEKESDRKPRPKEMTYLSFICNLIFYFLGIQKLIIILGGRRKGLGSEW